MGAWSLLTLSKYAGTGVQEEVYRKGPRSGAVSYVHYMFYDPQEGFDPEI